MEVRLKIHSGTKASLFSHRHLNKEYGTENNNCKSLSNSTLPHGLFRRPGAGKSKVGKPWPVVITKQGDNVSEVLVKRSGILDEPFAPDVPGYPAYFAFKDLRLSFLNDYAVYYEWNGKQEATTKYVLVKEGSNFNLDPGATNQLVATYATATFKNQTSARDNVKAEKAELAEAERKANSLEEKAVAKIEIQLASQPAKVAHFSEAIKYGVGAQRMQ